jgi:hypothetical protein
MRTDGDLIQLLIYVAIGVIGVVVSAYKNKMKKQQAATKPGFPGNFPSDPGGAFGPDLGPLMELFDIPKKAPEPYDFETTEGRTSVEEAGMVVDTKEAAAELAGLKIDAPESSLGGQKESDVQLFEEGQSDIQNMIANYEAIRRELDRNGMEDDIAMGEIVSVEAEEAARAKAGTAERFFNPRKAIIYAEILKRREY